MMPILKLFGMTFEWHDDKFALVYHKRGITLEEVASVFFDDCCIEKEDFGEYDEQRILTIGMSEKGRLLVVVWTQKDDVIRVITAFFPSKHQEKEYANARY